MAIKKKSLDEEYLKSLREMASLPHNRQCFDCNQRGPNYINTTIGSFVCMTCSGLLRGLNPPHRVKSISMANFTAEEMDFIRSRGNEFCRKVWLGLQDRQPFLSVDAKDEHRIQDAMSEKYEKKRWYVPPQEAMYEEARKQNVGSEVRQTSAKTLSSMIGNSPPILCAPPVSRPGQVEHSSSIQRPTGVGRGHLASGAQLTGQLPSPHSPSTRSPSYQSTKPTSFDLLSDLGTDPFTFPPTSQQSGNSPAFAAFDFAQPMETLTASSPIQAASQHQAVNMAQLGAPPPITSDKYSALAELDGVFSSTASAPPNLGWELSSPTSTGSRSQTSWGVSSPMTGHPPGSSFGAYGGAMPGSNPFGMSASSPLYNPFSGNVIMTPGYSQQVAAGGFGQYGLPQQTPMAVGYGQFSGMPVTARVQYGFPNGVELTGGNTWAGKVSMPVGGLAQSGPSGWGQPSTGVNPFLNASTNNPNALNPFM